MPPADRPPTTDPARAARLRAIFDEAIERPAAARAAWVDAHVADADERAALHRLLEADDRDGPLERPADEHMQRIGLEEAPFAAGLVGQCIGAFRLTRLIGEGGMAVVFHGEREGGQFRQEAAVKLLRRGLWSPFEQRLFRREQQALASLSHPNITRLIDGGISDAGVPYLILEYVHGVPITDYVAAQACGLRERLALFVVVCRAVAAAHRQLIVHRDLKPSNILVDAEQQVKLLDFGIAKLLADDGDAVRTEMTVLTPGYAAPEQFSGGTVTTATDVYSLGVVLHELLLGERPPAASTSRPALAPVDAGPHPAIAIGRELDNVLRKALSDAPERRYDSAAEFADDVERYLAEQPVLAHPPSRWYRARKFVRRHRGGAALTSVLIVAILASLSLAVRYAREAGIEAANARAEAERANAARDFIEGMFEPVRQQVAEGRTPSLRELVGAGYAQLERDTDLGVLQRIDLLLMFSRLHESLAETGRSGELAEHAHALAAAALPADSPLRIRATLAFAKSLLEEGDLTRAETLLGEAWQPLQRQGTASDDLIELYANLARLQVEADRPEQAVQTARAELAARLALYGDSGSSAGSGYNNLGFALQAAGRFDEAADEFLRALAIDARAADPQNLQRAYPLGNLAQALYNGGRLVEARQRFAEALALHEAIGLQAPPRLLIGQLAMLAATEQALGDLAAAGRTFDRLAYWAERTPASDSARSLTARGRAQLALESGRIADAVRELERAEALLPALPELARQRAEGHRDMIRAEIALLGASPAEAIGLAHSGVEKFGEKTYPPHVHRYGLTLLALACAAAESVEDPRCDRSYENAAAALAAAPYRDHPTLLRGQTALARVELARGDAGDAARRLRTALQAAERRGVDAHSPRPVEAGLWLAVALARQADCRGAAEAAARFGPAAARWPAHALLEPPVAASRQPGRCGATGTPIGPSVGGARASRPHAARPAAAVAAIEDARRP
ncbi:MAG TPA: serine/threonine-protein kinase [Dokdonella sp.]|uniref:serine/threonine-protein kinase n=1 Tax=Dokdonella sp. TaxID=2291710 RepID=UPI002C015B45|nr:serine/threonine-protein kinase [Dokdonella sp.]HUD41670.1 serine/threonine-protein kinase [Dokdonella sp.]